MYENDPKYMPTEAPIPTQAAEEEGQPVVEQEVPEAVQEPEPILGKFKSVDDLAKSYQELESAHGRKSTELGDLRKQNDLLARNLELLQSQMAQSKQPATQAAAQDLQSQISALGQQLDNGDIDIKQYGAMLYDLASQNATQKAMQEFQRYDQEKTVKSYQEKFLEQNPEFNDFLQSPERQALRKANPLHDDFSAFFNWKADKLAAEKELAAKTAYEQGKSEVEKLKSGAEAQAGKVLSKPGTTIRQQANKPLSDRELKAAMLAKYTGK